MKPLRMIWVGMSHEGHITCGKQYKIVSKTRDLMVGNTLMGYSYQFIDDAGNLESAAASLFLRPKTTIHQKRGP